ncbi:hypothetical protein TNCV_4216891 [Trichonephila clavipes]|nr:hypothetical protein TNCV_4216891 [Trichonephila clavipes]
MKCQVSAKVLDTRSIFCQKVCPSHFKDYSGMVPIDRRSFLLSFPRSSLQFRANVNNYSHYSWTKPEGVEVESERITALFNAKDEQQVAEGLYV